MIYYILVDPLVGAIANQYVSYRSKIPCILAPALPVHDAPTHSFFVQVCLVYSWLHIASETLEVA